MRLTPNYDIGCKRPTISDIYLPTFNNPCVELNTTGIKRITSEGIVTADERELQFDAIVFATGFDVTRSINAFVQVGSENKDFAEEDTPRAFLGITKPNQPNFFMLFGPGTINTSVIFMIECQVTRLSGLSCTTLLLDKVLTTQRQQTQIFRQQTHKFRPPTQLRQLPQSWRQEQSLSP